MTYIRMGAYGLDRQAHGWDACRDPRTIKLFVKVCPEWLKYNECNLGTSNPGQYCYLSSNLSINPQRKGRV